MDPIFCVCRKDIDKHNIKLEAFLDKSVVETEEYLNLICFLQLTIEKLITTLTDEEARFVMEFLANNSKNAKKYFYKHAKVKSKISLN